MQKPARPVQPGRQINQLAYRVCGTECKYFAGFRRHCQSQGQYYVSVILSTTLIRGWKINSYQIVTLSACGWVINTFANRLAMRFRFKSHRFVRKMTWSCSDAQRETLLDNTWKAYHVSWVKLGTQNSSEAVNVCDSTKSHFILIESLSVSLPETVTTVRSDRIWA